MLQKDKNSYLGLFCRAA